MSLGGERCRLMLSFLRKIQAGTAALVTGVLVGAMIVVAIWKPWRTPAAKGRIVLTEPAPRFELPSDFSVTLPDSPLVEKRTKPGPAVEVQTLVPTSEKDARKLEREFSLDLDLNRLLALKDLPRAPYGGSVAVTAVESGDVDVTVRARPAPWFDASWTHSATLTYARIWPGGGALDIREYSYEPVTLKLKGRVSLTPVVGYREITGTTIEGPYMGARLSVSLGPRDRR